MAMNWWILRRRIHTSWFVATISLAIVVGVILAQYVPNGWFASLGWLVAAVLLLGLSFLRKYACMLLLVAIAGLVVGLWRGSDRQQQLTPFAHIVDHSVTVVGTVSDDPDIGKDGSLVLTLGDLQIDGHAIAGTVWASVSDKRDVKRSDVVTVQGKLLAGFGSFSASMYRGQIVSAQRPVPGDIARQARDWFADAVRKAIPEPEASLGIGYLVGQRSALPAELDTALRLAGITHVVVASGYNLTILVRLARRLFVKVSKYLAALAGGVMIVAFIAVTGASPSMSRAGIVAGLSLLAWYYGRKFHPLVLLPFAAAVTLLINPSYGWNDLGWQLSFTAFAGVMVLGSLMQAYFFGDEKPGIVRQIIGETIAAELCTLPIIVMAFSQFSNVSLAANLLILPFVPLAMLCTFVAGIASVVAPSIATVVGFPASALLQYMVQVTEYLAHIPWAQTQVNVTGVAVGVYYLVLASICVYLWRKTKLNLREANLVE